MNLHDADTIGPIVDQDQSGGMDQAQPEQQMSSPQSPEHSLGDPTPDTLPANMLALSVRAAVTGVLTGFANLVPGISAGAVLLATGVFRDFIGAMSDIATFKLRRRSLVFLAVLGTAWVLAVLVGAGIVKELVTNHRWVMYSLFIGLTLGGVPLVWLRRDERDTGFWSAAAIGLLIMSGLGAMQMSGVLSVGDAQAGIPLLLLGGLLAAGATVLPGGSGTFVLILMGLYVPILRSVSTVKDALVDRDIGVLFEQAWTLAPFAVGMLGGLISVSLLTKWSLSRFPRATFGLLLGLLLGSVVALFPFQRGVPPQIGDIVKGQAVTAETIARIEPDDWPVQFFAPGAFEVAVALLLITAALIGTVALCRFEARLEKRGEHAA